MKGMPQDPAPRQMTSASRVQREWSSVRPFGGDDQKTDFTPSRVAIEKLDGTIVAERLDPRESFAGHTLIIKEASAALNRTRVSCNHASIQGNRPNVAAFATACNCEPRML
jgi:hypothetical protein